MALEPSVLDWLLKAALSLPVPEWLSKEWLSKVAIGAITGLTVQILLSVAKRFPGIISSVIGFARQQQEIHQSELFGVYADLEELLGDFLEKYRQVARKNPTLNRWDFLRQILFDALSLISGLTQIIIRRLLGFDETPRA